MERVQWSKIRSRLRDLLAADIARRVDYQLTSYRVHVEDAHEVWITIDKNRIFSASCRSHMKAMSELWYQNQFAVGPDGLTPEDILKKREIHDACDAVSSFRAYLDLDPHVALTSADPILRGLAMLDRRIGWRTLKAIEVSENEHSLIRTLYSLRMDSEKG